MAYKYYIIFLLLWSLHNLSTYSLFVFFLIPAAAENGTALHAVLLFIYPITTAFFHIMVFLLMFRL